MSTLRELSCRSPAGGNVKTNSISARNCLIVSDDHHVIASCIHNSLGHLPLGQQGIHGEYPARQDELAQYRLDLRDLTGLIVHRLLGHGETQMVGQSRQQ